MEKILDRLKEDRIFGIDKNDDGTFTLTELCDEYFDTKLTPAELMQLTVEIRQLLND